MVKKALYLGMQVTGNPKTGGEYGQLRNRKMLLSAVDEVDVVEIPKVGIFTHIINVFLGRGYGYTRMLQEDIEHSLQKQYDVVFVDSSVYGAYVRYFHNFGLSTILFCHNVEYDYYRTKFESKRSLMNFVLIHYIHRQEKLSISNATKIITLNERDNNALKFYYKRTADLILPLFYEDIGKSETCIVDESQAFLLFVGADFCANNDGIEWFIKNVCPYIKTEIRIAGGCCNAVSKKMEEKCYPNVKLLGFVDDLDSVYRRASGVVCPIFAGSGMKTKTIEALKYGKSVYGTAEAFEGINADFDRIGALCNSAEDFIRAINNATFSTFNQTSYDFFLKNFSTDAVYPKFKDFINSLC